MSHLEHPSSWGAGYVNHKILGLARTRRGGSHSRWQTPSILRHPRSRWRDGDEPGVVQSAGTGEDNRGDAKRTRSPAQTGIASLRNSVPASRCLEASCVGSWLEQALVSSLEATSGPPGKRLTLPTPTGLARRAPTAAEWLNALARFQLSNPRGSDPTDRRHDQDCQLHRIAHRSANRER